jgi:hypothetical protein
MIFVENSANVCSCSNSVYFCSFIERIWPSYRFTDWKRYEINLADADLHDITHLFGFLVNNGQVFYVKEAVYYQSLYNVGRKSQLVG